MALATTCPQCKTSFKVVPDQLKLRRGLVRCGVCQHVFSGIDYLRYVDDAARAAQRAARAATDGSAQPGAPAAAGTRPPPGPGSDAGAGAVEAPRAPAAAAPWAALAAPQGTAAGQVADGIPTPSGEPPAPSRGDPWAAAAAAAHERSLRDDTPLLPQAPPPAPGPRESATAADARHAAGADAADAAGARGGPGRGEAGSPRPQGAPGRSAPDTVTGAPATRPWPVALTGPQTVISPDDDLKTAFFLTDSGFGPYPGEQTDVMPPTSIHRAGSSVEPTTFIRGDLGPVAIPPPGVPLRPETPFPPAAPELVPAPQRIGPMATPLRAADTAAVTHAPEPMPEPAPAGAPAEAAIDYFSGGRRRGRGLGLALSPAAWVGAIGLSALLALQAIVGWRDSIASAVPALAPALAAVMSPFGLSIAPPRDLSALTIESFELQSAGAPNLLQMTAVLRNRSGHAVGFPAMELTLTDSAGGLLVRKVIPAETYLAGAPVASRGLEARSEWPLKLALENGGPPPTGYSVALFYP
jgi:predicted Zn finger-like uncharacterized protein